MLVKHQTHMENVIQVWEKRPRLTQGQLKEGRPEKEKHKYENVVPMYNPLLPRKEDDGVHRQLFQKTHGGYTAKTLRQPTKSRQATTLEQTQ